ncbi:MAG TPA: hypothetical protein VF596_11615 [Pyrinomonadaceae bacterium]|jgi:hypothetical protein
MRNFAIVLCVMAFSVSPNSLSSMTQPAQSQATTAECPKILVSAPDPFDKTVPLKFEVHLEGVKTNDKLGYEWVISKGRIKSGQGSYIIIVEAKDYDRQGLTATVSISGLPCECQSAASASTEIA